MTGDWEVYGLIVTLGLITYATRIGGHLILSRFDRLNPRVEAALDAVPAAVMTAIVAPMALVTGPLESIAAAIAIIAALRL
ncbi:MAG TPA: AzlD domain-containing protein, partial [Afifellaceae bacterium]|nr:AzlD domain-containing protein [Afifellaceae bacterium]